jgi:uncharacterized protein
VRYAASRRDTQDMAKVLLSVCLGADSTAVAPSKHPEEFSEIQAMVMLQPVSARYVVEEFVKGIGMPDGYAKFDKAVHERTGFHLADNPHSNTSRPLQSPRLSPKYTTTPRAGRSPTAANTQEQMKDRAG